MAVPGTEIASSRGACGGVAQPARTTARIMDNRAFMPRPRSKLEMAVEPGEGVGLHLPVELVPSRVEVAPVHLRRSRAPEHVGHHLVRALHLRQGVERVFGAVENLRRLRGA